MAASEVMVFRSAGLAVRVLGAALEDSVLEEHCRAGRFCLRLALAARVAVRCTYYPGHWDSRPCHRLRILQALASRAASEFSARSRCSRGPPVLAVLGVLAPRLPFVAQTLHASCHLPAAFASPVLLSADPGRTGAPYRFAWAAQTCPGIGLGTVTQASPIWMSDSCPVAGILAGVALVAQHLYLLSTQAASLCQPQLAVWV